jgi:hypothetical protein
MMSNNGIVAECSRGPGMWSQSPRSGQPKLFCARNMQPPEAQKVQRKVRQSQTARAFFEANTAPHQRFQGGVARPRGRNAHGKRTTGKQSPSVNNQQGEERS